MAAKIEISDLVTANIIQRLYFDQNKVQRNSSAFVDVCIMAHTGGFQ